MNHRTLAVGIAGVVMLAPSVVMANGMVRMIQSFEFTFTGGLIGCVAGVIFALVRHAKIGRLLALTIGGGVAAGLTAAAMFVGGNMSFFFPNNAGIAGLLVIVALGTGVVGGLAAGLITMPLITLLNRIPTKPAAAPPGETR